MQYDGGLPTGKTVLTFERLGQASYASHLLVDAHISSIPIQVEGFERAVEKNDGFEDEIKSPVAPGNALILGFPSSWRLQDVNDFLFPYKLDYFGTPLEAISCILQYETTYVLPLENKLTSIDRTSQSARWSVALASLSESHRLVRHLHMRRFDLTGKGEKTSLQCQVLYLS